MIRNRLFALPTILCMIICLLACKSAYHKHSLPAEININHDTLAQYRDTLVGRFNGRDIDTLICEPVGQAIKDDQFGELYFEWSVYTTNNTVNKFKVGNTIGIKFVKEGDLDGNKTEEWGFLTEFPTSSWTTYQIFTAKNGKWKSLVNPIQIWRDHLEEAFTENDIAQPSGKKGYIKIKTSDVTEDVTNWIVVDSIVPISIKEYSYDLVKW